MPIASKESSLPSAIVVQSAVFSLNFENTFTIKEIADSIYKTYKLNNNEKAAGDIARRNLYRILCLKRSKKGVKPLTLTRKKPQKKDCLNCPQNRHLSAGCTIKDTQLKNFYFPQTN